MLENLGNHKLYIRQVKEKCDKLLTMKNTLGYSLFAEGVPDAKFKGFGSKGVDGFLLGNSLFGVGASYGEMIRLIKGLAA